MTISKRHSRTFGSHRQPTLEGEDAHPHQQEASDARARRAVPLHGLAATRATRVTRVATIAHVVARLVRHARLLDALPQLDPIAGSLKVLAKEAASEENVPASTGFTSVTRQAKAKAKAGRARVLLATPVAPPPDGGADKHAIDTAGGGMTAQSTSGGLQSLEL